MKCSGSRLQKNGNMLESLNWDLNLGAFRHLENLCEGANLLIFRILFQNFNFFLTKGSKCITMCKIPKQVNTCPMCTIST